MALYWRVGEGCDAPPRFQPSHGCNPHGRCNHADGRGAGMEHMAASARERRAMVLDRPLAPRRVGALKREERWPGKGMGDLAPLTATHLGAECL